MSSRAVGFVSFGLAASLLIGCGSGDQLDVAPVRGTVTCNGKTLTSGDVTFSPIAESQEGMPGKPAFGSIGPDGTFVLTTYESNDGAVIGKHRVTYTPALPGQGGDSEEEDGDSEMGEPITASQESMKAAAQSDLPCKFGGTAEVEVVAGENNLTIELTPTALGGGEQSDSEMGG